VHTYKNYHRATSCNLQLDSQKNHMLRDAAHVTQAEINCKT
jgi:hypothetical protein